MSGLWCEVLFGWEIKGCVCVLYIGKDVVLYKNVYLFCSKHNSSDAGLAL